MNYDLYRTFYYVATYKSFTRAAAALFTSQPAVSRAVQKLEAELGCLLFVRAPSGVECTREGEQLYLYVSAAHNCLLKGEDELSRSADPGSGHIYIGATVTALYGLLLGHLDDFHKQHPAVRYKISTGSTNHVIEMLKNGAVDLAFVSTPCRAAKPLRTAILGEFHDILIAGQGYAALSGRPLRLEELARYPLVCLRQGMQLREFIDDFFAARGLPVSVDIELDGADRIVPLVGRGLGLGFVPQKMAQEALDRGEVFRVALEEELPPRQICMLTDPRRPRTQASRAFVHTIRGTFEAKDT